MLRYSIFVCCAFICCFFAGVTSNTSSFAADDAAENRTSLLGTLEDFSKLPPGPFQKGFLDSWRWSDEVRAQFRSSTQLEIVEAANGKTKQLRVRVNDEKVLAGEALSLLRLAPFYPPQADALRIRLRVTSGQAVLYVGGPTAYYGNSDVYTEPQTIRAEQEPRTIEVVCNFNHPTWRNYRRAGFSTAAPRNYYSRWAQEPLGVFVAAGTRGEFFIESIELLALGEGKPFAEFPPEQVRHVKNIADFEEGRLDSTFTLYMADGETEWFEQSWKREKPLRFVPQQLSVVEAGLMGKKSLASVGRTAEEVHCAGIRTSGAADANAFAVTMSMEAPEQQNTLLGVGPTLPVDFLVFVAPVKKPFPWQRFAASKELRSFSGPGFDYQLSYRVIRDDADVDFAIYQTRRYLSPAEWKKLVLPAADFTCVYGHGSYRDRLIEHQPLTCDDVIAIAWLIPWCRMGRGDSQVTTRLDELSFVQVPGTAAEQRSFWQVPDVKSLQRRESTSPRGRIQHIALPEDSVK